jgi:hypothetical protein
MKGVESYPNGEFEAYSVVAFSPVPFGLDISGNSWKVLGHSVF